MKHLVHLVPIDELDWMLQYEPDNMTDLVEVDGTIPTLEGIQDCIDEKVVDHLNNDDLVERH